jgi:hypothetical protein
MRLDGPGARVEYYQDSDENQPLFVEWFPPKPPATV